MRYFAVLQDGTLLHLLGDQPFLELKAKFLVNSLRLAKKLRGRGHKVKCGDITSGKFYRQFKITSEDTLIFHFARTGNLKKALKNLRQQAPEAYALVLSETETPSLENCISTRIVSIPSLCNEGLSTAINDLHNQKRVDLIRSILKDVDRVIILLQNDPDPDAIASGLALRTLLGRNKVTAPLTSFGKVQRPENLAMLKLLELEVEPFRDEYLKVNHKLAMVDVQPPYFNGMFPEVDVVIDHHPRAGKYEASYQDLRIKYGATSTILTEYLRADKVKLTQKLATALLYGIKSDTLLLDRETDPADMAAFTYLYPHANHNLMRRIERPELPEEGLNSFADALKNRIIEDKVIFCHMENCGREDLIPQFADFCLQVEGVEWSVVSGIVEGNLIISVRNVGYIRSAGEVLRDAFGRLGNAGGHRAMARATIPLGNLQEYVDIMDPSSVRAQIAKLFLSSLGEEC